MNIPSSFWTRLFVASLMTVCLDTSAQVVNAGSTLTSPDLAGNGLTPEQMDSLRNSDQYQQSLSELQRLATEQPDQEAFGTVLLARGLSRDEIANWLETCDCVVVNLESRFLQQGGQSSGNASFSDFALYEGSVMERLVFFETRHRKRHAMMIEAFRRKNVDPGIGPMPTPGRMPPSFFGGCRPSEPLPEQRNVPEPLTVREMSFNYIQLQVIASYAGLAYMQNLPDVFWVRSVPEKYNQLMLDSFMSRAEQLRPLVETNDLCGDMARGRAVRLGTVPALDTAPAFVIDPSGAPLH